MQDGRAVPDLGYADGFVLLARITVGLQRLLDAVAQIFAAARQQVSQSHLHSVTR